MLQGTGVGGSRQWGRCSSLGPVAVLLPWRPALFAHNPRTTTGSGAARGAGAAGLAGTRTWPVVSCTGLPSFSAPVRISGPCGVAVVGVGLARIVHRASAPWASCRGCLPPFLPCMLMHRCVADCIRPRPLRAQQWHARARPRARPRAHLGVQHGGAHDAGVLHRLPQRVQRGLRGWDMGCARVTHACGPAAGEFGFYPRGSCRVTASRTWWYSCEPWLKLKRATDMPARSSSSSTCEFGDQQALRRDGGGLRAGPSLAPFAQAG